MSKKIYNSPSSQPANTYAVGNTNEQEQCRKIAAALDKAEKRCGFDVKTGMDGTMYTRVAESNSFGADLHMPIHTNAFDKKVAGLRIMISKRGGEAEKIAEAVMAELAPITPGTSDGISVQKGLYEINASNAICVYVEVGFHDNKEEAQWIIDHTEDIAEAICKALCKHYGVKYVAPTGEMEPEEKPAQKPTQAEGEVFYRVQVGAFSNRDNAERFRDELQDKGYEGAFVVEVRK